ISPLRAESEVIGPVGASVITDIDDTVKVTCVGKRIEMLNNTFVHPFRPVNGMPAAYRRWGEAGAAFHYVSSSPWQLYKPLVEFLDEQGLPRGSFHLRTLQLQGPSLLRQLTGGKRSKKKAIRNILAWYPGRQFVLVGDAGEKDPEIYGSIARRHPVQVAAIFIRRVENANLSPLRFEKAFRGLPDHMGRLFDDPAELGEMHPVQQEGLIRWKPAGA
ncbi:MAG: App1 family protein, partial [Planctomycetota bacterium]